MIKLKRDSERADQGKWEKGEYRRCTFHGFLQATTLKLGPISPLSKAS